MTEKSIYDNDFTQDEIDCLKKMIYKFRQEEILELYNKNKSDRLKYHHDKIIEDHKKKEEEINKPKPFLVKAKDFVKKWYGMVW